MDKKFFRSLDLSKNLTDKELELFISRFEEKNYKTGDFIFKHNTERNEFMIIYSGKVEIFKQTPWGEERLLLTFGKGDFIAEGSLLDYSVHTTSAKCLEPTTVYAFDTKKNSDFLKDYSFIILKIIQYIAKTLQRRMHNSSLAYFKRQHQLFYSGKTRLEHDLLGEKEVPEEALYGIQTLRAIENFSISGITLNFFPNLVKSLAYVKKAAAIANNKLGILDDKIADAIIRACDEIIDGKWHEQFSVDMIQGGAGTSTNMNANEVIANRALEILGHKRGEYQYCHPNNHVNLSQSTNDAYPSAVHIAVYMSNLSLLDNLKSLIESFRKKGKEFADIIKMGRTQLQDAVPMTLGQTFDAYADSLDEEIPRLKYNAEQFLEVNMGATAIGTGINSEPEYRKYVIEALREITGYEVHLAENLIEATQDTSPLVMYSSALKYLALKLSKISNDLRLLSSGPRAGLNEINLPAVQPGSSIMPGKVNPVIPEVVNQISFRVIGNDLTVSLASEAGQLELNVMEPIITLSIFENIEILKNGMDTLKYKCIDGITANAEVCRNYVLNSIGLVTALNPYIGYENSSMIAKEALKTGKRVYDLVLEKGLLSAEQLDEILKPENMIAPRKFNFNNK